MANPVSVFVASNGRVIVVPHVVCIEGSPDPLMCTVCLAGGWTVNVHTKDVADLQKFIAEWHSETSGAGLARELSKILRQREGAMAKQHRKERERE